MALEHDTDTRDAEIVALRARVADLEEQLAEQARRSNALVAQSQQKLYWLERWQVDLDSLMARPGAVPALEALRSLRGVTRTLRVTLRRLRGRRP